MQHHRFCRWGGFVSKKTPVGKCTKMFVFLVWWGLLCSKWCLILYRPWRVDSSGIPHWTESCQTRWNVPTGGQDEEETPWGSQTRWNILLMVQKSGYHHLEGRKSLQMKIQTSWFCPLFSQPPFSDLEGCWEGLWHQPWCLEHIWSCLVVLPRSLDALEEFLYYLKGLWIDFLNCSFNISDLRRL